MKPFITCLLLLLNWCAAAQTPDSLAPAARPAPTPPAGAAVVLAPNDTLFRVYGRVGSFGPRERAEAIQGRLRALLDAPLFAPDSLYVVDSERDSEIMYADAHVLSVGEAEAQALGQPRQAVARQYLATLRRQLTAAQQASSLPALLQRGALAVLSCSCWPG
ncbi:hypothetical protein I2I05_18685 [Hymenobacter sp. BT683]|uniref:Uncharacterized protein n=1 Tax=Hymenobacter jeongseonensis TaxID=2791027 RepID=A0ABS0IM74_9BACT|nr:hypothetical protein [Hymenobacter jeongseonensis]MBF9239426.1 hypothetical protein [Hymenobacter jeongseonensis]